MNNPDIAEHGKATRFGQPCGADPRTASANGKPWSIRNELRYLAAQKIGPEKLDEELKRLRRPFGESQISLARAVALGMFEKVLLKDANANFFGKLIENIEGKLTQPVQDLPPPKQYDFSSMTKEERQKAYDELCGR